MIRLARREFVRTAGAAAGCGLAASLSWPRRIAAEPDQDFEPLTRWLTDTPRERLLPELVERIRRGLDHGTLAAAITEAAARGVQPYPSVGFKYHTVMVMQSVYTASQKLPDRDRWLPLIWAADYFKDAQATESRRSGWRMPAGRGSVTDRANARQTLVRALEDWDREAADAAIVSWVDDAPRQEVADLLFRYAARDFRAIGHKAITACNAFQITDFLNWRSSPSLFRSLVAAIQNHEGDPNPATDPGKADRAWHINRRHVGEPGQVALWGAADAGATVDLLDVMRHGDDLEASQAAFGMLQRGLPPEALWDAVFAFAGELMLRRSNIISVHANTTAHALRVAFGRASSRETQLLMLLQCVSFMPGFRDLLPERQRDLRIDRLEPLPLGDRSRDPLDEIFEDVSDNRIVAARKILRYLRSGGDESGLRARARRYVVYNTTGSHDYKFVEALFANADWMKPPMRPAYVAAGSLYFNGSKDKQNKVVAEVLATMGNP